MDRVTGWVIALVGIPTLLLTYQFLAPPVGYNGPVNLLEQTDPDATVKVLFIGDSITEYNNLPKTVHHLLQDMLPDEKVLVRRFTPKTAGLNDHLRETSNERMETRLELLLRPDRNGQPYWNAIVLQAHSLYPGLEEKDPAHKEMLQAAKSLGLKLAGAGREIILFMTWGFRDGAPEFPKRFANFPTMQKHLAAGYFKLADIFAANGAEKVAVAPVGLAFEALYKEQRNRQGATVFNELYAPDYNHRLPSPMGSYLAACVVVATYGKVPIAEKSLYVPKGMNETDILKLQRVADDTVFKAPFDQRR